LRGDRAAGSVSASIRRVARAEIPARWRSTKPDKDLQGGCMKLRTWFRTLACAGALATSIAAHGHTTAAAGSVIVIPIVALTASYSTEVHVANPQSVPITVNVKFYEANTSFSPGLKTCTPLAVTNVESFNLLTQCSGQIDPTKNHHGMLILEDAAAVKINYFFAFSRTQTPGGNGFSVEGFPVGNFSGAVGRVFGLKRQAAAPIYQSNCFVAALGEAVDYKIELFDGPSGTAIGSAVTGSLAPYQMIRHLDIFTAAGAPAGDYSNVRARFDETSTGEPAYIGFCTVQESTFFGADFRMSKSVDANDLRQFRKVCYSMDSTCTTEIVGTGQTALAATGTKFVHQIMITPPDYVKCDLVSARLADLEMRIRGPGDPFASPVFATSPPYDSGGDGKTSFYIYTGERNAVNGGFATRWFIDVSYREGSADSTVPIPFGMVCYSGNGITYPWLRGTAADDF
jgi:hypothetical protein